MLCILFADRLIEVILESHVAPVSTSPSVSNVYSIQFCVPWSSFGTDRTWGACNVEFTQCHHIIDQTLLEPILYATFFWDGSYSFIFVKHETNPASFVLRLCSKAPTQQLGSVAAEFARCCRRCRPRDQY